MFSFVRERPPFVTQFRHKYGKTKEISCFGVLTVSLIERRPKTALIKLGLHPSLTHSLNMVSK